MKRKPIAYPIQPRHLDTSDIPKGFDPMVDYGEKVILWALVQYCQYRKNWNSFTWNEFMSFVDDKSIKINGPIRSGGSFFTGPGVNFLFTKHEEENNVWTLTPTHYMISVYFLWNPIKLIKK